MGNCGGNKQPGNENTGRRGMGGLGLGRGNGCGLGRGRRNGFGAGQSGYGRCFDADSINVTPEDRIAFLSRQEDSLKRRLDIIAERKKVLDSARENKGE
jgi:hypothetical protein